MSLKGRDAPPGSPTAPRTRKQQGVIQAPLREAVGPEGGPVLIKVLFSSFDLETWKGVAKGYRNDPLGVACHVQFLTKQHGPDWGDIQLLLDHMTETEKQFILKTSLDLAQDKMGGGDVKEHFPLQDTHWDPNRMAERGTLDDYRDGVAKAMERVIPKAINWSALYAVRQGHKESPSEFLDKLWDTMRRHTPLDPRSKVGIQQLVSLFIGQSATGILWKL